MFPDLHQYPRFTIDIETTGLRWWKDKVFGVALSTLDGDWYWDVRDEPNTFFWLQNAAKNYEGLIINHNIKFDYHFLREAGVVLPEDRIDDTMIRAALIDEHLLTYDLDSLGHKYVQVGKDVGVYQELAALFGGKPTKNVQAQNLWRAPKSLVAKYAKQDTKTTLRLWERQEEEIKRQELQRVCELERQLLPVIIEMERGGVRVDIDKAELAVYDIDRIAKQTQYELNKLAGFEINPNPSTSIKTLFKPIKDKNDRWVLVDGTIAPSTPAGEPSIDSSVLRVMKHPAAAMILSLRKMIKTRDTFLKGHILGHHHNGVIHANYNQTKSDNDLGTGTGRLSVNNPALQQIHKRDKEIAAVVRALFLPDEGDNDWVCNDWAQMDFRVFAHYVNDPRIITTYTKNPDTDFHQLTADLTGLPRSARFAGDANAKQTNLAMCFGMGQGKLAAEMGLPYTIEKGYDGRDFLKPGPEAMEMFERYHSNIPGIKSLSTQASSVAKSRGFVRTILGRRIRFPGGKFIHKAAGLIFQGSAADALKVKLIEVHKYLKEQNCGARLLLNVHDEFDISVPKGQHGIRENISLIVTGFDEGDVIKFRVPIRTDQGIGSNWWEASK